VKLCKYNWAISIKIHWKRSFQVDGYLSQKHAQLIKGKKAKVGILSSSQINNKQQITITERKYRNVRVTTFIETPTNAWERMAQTLGRQCTIPKGLLWFYSVVGSKVWLELLLLTENLVRLELLSLTEKLDLQQLWKSCVSFSFICSSFQKDSHFWQGPIIIVTHVPNWLVY